VAPVTTRGPHTCELGVKGGPREAVQAQGPRTGGARCIPPPRPHLRRLHVRSTSELVRGDYFHRGTCMPAPTSRTHPPTHPPTLALAHAHSPQPNACMVGSAHRFRAMGKVLQGSPQLPRRRVEVCRRENLGVRQAIGAHDVAATQGLESKGKVGGGPGGGCHHPWSRHACAHAGTPR
jgi:hypothetical protein